MSVLDQTLFFSGADSLGDNDLGKLEVGNFHTDVDEALRTHFGWTGKAIGAVGLALAPDKLRVTNGFFLTRGQLDLKDKKMAANSIWGAAKPNINLVITFPMADVFHFDSGGLWSEFVPSSEVPHTFHDATEGQSGRALLSNDNRLEGTEPSFCLRMVTQLSSQSSAAKGVVLCAVIMLYPASADDVIAAVESKFAGWPGLKIGEVFMALGPRPTDKWQCPVLPFILPPAPFEEDDFAPACSKLRDAIAAIMRNARIHDGLKSGADVLAKWDKIRTNPRALMDKMPGICWPEPTTENSEDLSGKYLDCSYKCLLYVDCIGILAKYTIA
jgi:hypothetical protein